MIIVRAAKSHLVQAGIFPMRPPGLGVTSAPRASHGPEEAAGGATSHLPPHIWSSLPSHPHYTLTDSPATHTPSAPGRYSDYSHGHVLLPSPPAPGQLFLLWLPVSAGEILRPCGLRPSLGPRVLQCRQQPVSHLLCGLLLLLPDLRPGRHQRPRRLGAFYLQQPRSLRSERPNPDAALLQGVVLRHHLHHQEVEVQVPGQEAADGQWEGEAEDEGSDQGSPSPQGVPPTLGGPCRTDPDQDRNAAPHHPLHLTPVGPAGPQRGGAGEQETLQGHGHTSNPQPVHGSDDGRLQTTTAVRLWQPEPGTAAVSSEHLSGMFRCDLRPSIVSDKLNHPWNDLYLFFHLDQFLTWLCFSVARFPLMLDSAVTTTGCHRNNSTVSPSLDTVETTAVVTVDPHHYIHCNNDVWTLIYLWTIGHIFVVLNPNVFLSVFVHKSVYIY